MDAALNLEIAEHQASSTASSTSIALTDLPVYLISQFDEPIAEFNGWIEVEVLAEQECEVVLASSAWCALSGSIGMDEDAGKLVHD